MPSDEEVFESALRVGAWIFSKSRGSIADRIPPSPEDMQRVTLYEPDGRVMRELRARGLI